MKKNKKIVEDEINLIEIIILIWQGKWKVVAAMVIAIITAYSFQAIQTQPTKNFTAKTQIRPISTVEKDKYFVFNNSELLGSYKFLVTGDENVNAIFLNGNVNRNNDELIDNNHLYVSRKKLLNLYVEILNEKSLFEDAIRKFNLIDATQYKDDQSYNEAIIKLASSVKISSPINNSKQKGRFEVSYKTLEFTYNNISKWKNALLYVDELANKEVKANLQKQFSRVILTEKKKREYKLEDISTKIDNLIIDSELEVSNKVLYLKEQSAIAKKLGIAKNTIEVQTFGNQSALLSNVQIDSPFYLRGYDAIDTEIELISQRTNTKAFIPELAELERDKRLIEQDRSLERLELLYATTPLSDNKFFYAASAEVLSTTITYNDYNNRKPLIPIALVIGFLIGIFYIFINNAVQSTLVSKKNRLN